jgi:hypothetical protein
MNLSLINELKSQCIVREQRGTTAFNSYMVDRFDTEKFAELIVRECIEQASIGNGHGNNQWDRALTFASKNIKEHFGVEE